MRSTTQVSLVIIFVALLSLGSTCTRPQTPQFDDQFIEARRGLVRTIGQEADIVFLGSVTTTGPPPPAWSGRLHARQAVAFQVERVLKGFAPGPTVTVYVPLVKGSRLAIGGNTPGLSATLFQTGNRLFVFARKGDPPATLNGIDENLGVIPATPANEIAIEVALGLR